MPGIKTNDLGAKKWNKVVDVMVDEYQAQVREFMRHLLIDGYPPFTEPVSQEEQYKTLVEMRDAGHPAFWQNAEAQAALDNLSQQFGEPAPVRPTPMAGDMGATPPGL